MQTNLLSAMELTTNMMREVKLLEERRKQAKEAATIAGQDILAKMEELKETSRHAKEANDMVFVLFLYACFFFYC